MNKILKRLLTGVLTLATVFTALPTTAVHAAETQYWTESEERVGIVEKVMNDGSIGSTFNEGHMTVEGEDAYCIDINTGFTGHECNVVERGRESRAKSFCQFLRSMRRKKLQKDAQAPLMVKRRSGIECQCLG